MDIQKNLTLQEKQKFWAEQLPNFESKYWLPSHFEFLAFDMDQGNYTIKDDLDPSFEDDATEIWHRVNTGWAMWKKAINFSKPHEGFVLVEKSEIGHYYYDESEGMYIDEPDHFLTDLDIGEAQEVKCRDYFDLPSKYAAKVWDEDNQDVGTWEFFNTETEANNVAAHCKAMNEAQEQSHE